MIIIFILIHTMTADLLVVEPDGHIKAMTHNEAYARLTSSSQDERDCIAQALWNERMQH